MPDEKYAVHPLKKEIDAKFDEGESLNDIIRWLSDEAIRRDDPSIKLSMHTLSRHRHRREVAKGNNLVKDSTKALQDRTFKKDNKISQLWETVKQCNKLQNKLDKNISIKNIRDWQYIDTQKQNALKLIAEITGEKSVGNDITIVLSTFLNDLERRKFLNAGHETDNATICGDILPPIPAPSGTI